MEMQYFTRPSEAPRFYDEWKTTRLAWHIEQGIPKDKLRFRDHADDERAHYAAAATDIQFEFPFGWNEFEGIHYRTDYDLRRHSEFSGKKLEYFDDGANERFSPHAWKRRSRRRRPTRSGALRTTGARQGRHPCRSWVPSLSRVQGAVLPLSKNERSPPRPRRLV